MMTVSSAMMFGEGAVKGDPLAAAVARGDREAIRALYVQHHVHVRVFARRLVGDDMAAEDLVHEVFVSLPSAIKGYRGEGTIRSFLIGVAVHHARHHVRAAARRRSAQERLALEPSSQVARPDEVAHRGQLARLLARALDELPLDQRVAFVLCEVEERTSVEAAAIVGASEGTVRARVFHAKKKLRAILEAHHE